MEFDVRPAEVFEDVRTLIGPKSPTASVCWCLSHRLSSKIEKQLRGPDRGAYVAELCRADPPPGVIAYDGDEPVGWAAVAPRAATSYARSRTIPHVDDLPVWSLWCLRVRPGHRKRGVTHSLIAGAVAFARDRGAPVLEAYPIDTGDDGDTRVDVTMAYAGLRRNFERAGFEYAAGTTSVLAGHPRVLMRLDLR
ncbi:MULTISPECIES: GNAT family N-acetyltransferase [unclassified Streptomyces]|uniref:GNAT family N-acetyltransferase n=1 Tax=unclassified Streptomyces TaxID=2593676 RepID=UPI00074A95C6|nr:MULTISPECIES: GNAT family N-acetyltransferase [unclassified Streptomyces]KUL71760.1 GCN5 family acetyltransferase [Streptomyces sp. NRRL WC-3604]KUL71821.1 GCN5 family acetyltransferase [Streptomyces sp. NRRL WC-3605]